MLLKDFMLNSFKKDIFLIFVLYTFAHGLILLNKGLYWDDWVFYNVDNTITIDRMWQTGRILTGYFISFIFSFDNTIFLFKLLVFLAYFFSALLLNSILKTINEIDSLSRLFIVLFFALFPVNSARVLLVTVHYALSYFLFFLGFWIVSKYMIHKKILWRLASLPVFFIPFFINSFLIFYFIIIIYILYTEKTCINSLDSLIKRTSKYIDFLLLPVVFWIIQSIFFKPFGFYQNYNKFNIHDLLQPLTYKNLSNSFNLSFIEVFKESSHSLSPYILLIFASILTLIILKQIKIVYQEQDKKDSWLFGIGILSFFLAVYPYYVVHHEPNLYDWQSRDQLLVPLGSSLIIYYGIKMILDKLKINISFHIFIFSILIVLFISANINNYINYEKDWYKQLSLIENFKVNGDIKNHTTFLFKDNTWDLNANRRTYRFYEYTGLMKSAFNDETRFGQNIYSFEGMDAYRLYFNAYYNMKDYQQKEPEFQIVINHGDYKLNNINNILNLKYLEIFKNTDFKTNVSQIVFLEVMKLN